MMGLWNLDGILTSHSTFSLTFRADAGGSPEQANPSVIACFNQEHSKSRTLHRRHSNRSTVLNFDAIASRLVGIYPLSSPERRIRIHVRLLGQAPRKHGIKFATLCPLRGQIQKWRG